MLYRQSFLPHATNKNTLNVKRGALTVGAGAAAYIDFTTVAPNRVVIWQETLANVPVSWKPSETTGDVCTAGPTPGGSPGDVEAEGQGFLNLPQFEMAELRVTHGLRYWHFFNHGAAPISLYVEGSLMGGSGE